MRSLPASDTGPVERPPWSLQRPLAIAGAWHEPPARVFASHLKRNGFERKESAMRSHRLSFGILALL